jgi:5-methylcytosine-specific restriction endonuclease McrA
MQTLILTLDQAGLPQAWVDIEEAITYHAKHLVAWSAGKHVCAYSGGTQRDGRRSRIETQSILALRGAGHSGRWFARAPVLGNDLLYARDRQVCAYCGDRCAARELSCDHVIPVSKGGKHVWTNVVTACRTCNGRKADRTPDEARMRLLYVPYTPSRHEHFILRNRHILADQMEYLLMGVPRGSRLRG